MRSMSGFGRGQAQRDGYAVQVDLRSLNHRYLEVRIRGLGELPGLAQRCEERLRETFSRGTLEASVRWEAWGAGEPRRLEVEPARRLKQGLEQLGAELGIEEQVGFSHLIQLGAFPEQPPEEEALWPPLEAALEEAIGQLLRSRESEGEKLRQALGREADKLRGFLKKAREEAPQALRAAEARLRERLACLQVPVDAERLEQELALWAERSDVTEELDRLAAHVDRLEELLSSSGAVGRELEFIGQEIGREAATLAAKARSVPLGQLALQIRLAAERIREQARNVE